MELGELLSLEFLDYGVHEITVIDPFSLSFIRIKLPNKQKTY